MGKAGVAVLGVRLWYGLMVWEGKGAGGGQFGAGCGERQTGTTRQ